MRAIPLEPVGRLAETTMKRKDRKLAAKPRAAVPAQQSHRRRWLARLPLVVLVIAVVAGASYALFDYVLPARLPAELVGTWRVVEGDMRGATMEFRRNGTMLGKFVQGDKEGIIEGTAEVDGNTLRTTTVNPYTRRPETGAQTIITLTDTEFVTEEARGSRIRMERVR
jgi:uncharacterized protein (TIGR03066 family)